MALYASSVTTMRLETELEQLPAGPAPAPTERPAATRHDRPRALEVAQCSLCDITLPLGLLVPDGGQACADVRWYCKDAISCTKRWTTARPHGQPDMSAAHGHDVAGTGEAPDEALAERLDGVLEEAKSA